VVFAFFWVRCFSQGGIYQWVMGDKDASLHEHDVHFAQHGFGQAKTDVHR
jgi:hypothetical protein